MVRQTFKESANGHTQGRPRELRQSVSEAGRDAGAENSRSALFWVKNKL